MSRFKAFIAAPSVWTWVQLIALLYLSYQVSELRDEAHRNYQGIQGVEEMILKHSR